MKIIRTKLPNKGSAKRVVLDTLADSWYQQGLNAQDIAEINAMAKPTVGLLLDLLVDEGLVKARTSPIPGRDITYFATDKAKELLDADRHAV